MKVSSSFCSIINVFVVLCRQEKILMPFVIIELEFKLNEIGVLISQLTRFEDREKMLVNIIKFVVKKCVS